MVVLAALPVDCTLWSPIALDFEDQIGPRWAACTCQQSYTSWIISRDQTWHPGHDQSVACSFCFLPSVVRLLCLSANASVPSSSHFKKFPNPPSSLFQGTRLVVGRLVNLEAPESCMARACFKDGFYKEIRIFLSMVFSESWPSILVFFGGVQCTLDLHV